MLGRNSGSSCPICEDYVVWVSGRTECCGAIWAYCHDQEPYLIEVSDSEEFGQAALRYDKLEKEFHLIPSRVD